MTAFAYPYRDAPETAEQRAPHLVRPVYACPECGVQFDSDKWSSKFHSRSCLAANYPPPEPTEYREPAKRGDWPWMKSETESR
jgi:hypothetical protein